MRLARWVGLLVIGATPLVELRSQSPERGVDIRIVISISERRLWIVNDVGDTLLSAPAAVGSGETMTWRGKRWTFGTPSGEYRVVSKEKDPVWIPPLWHYIEEARARQLRVVELRADGATTVADGRSLRVRRDTVGIIGPDSTFRALPTAGFIVFGDALYVPPFGSAQRRIKGTLGSYRLNLGRGFGIHGTSDHASIPKPVTHGCVRLHDADIAWLFARVPVGARVTVF